MAGAECGIGGKIGKFSVKGFNGTVPRGELNPVAIMGDIDDVRVKGGIPLPLTPTPLANGTCGVATALTFNVLEEGGMSVNDRAGMSGDDMIAYVVLGGVRIDVVVATGSDTGCTLYTISDTIRSRSMQPLFLLICF